MIGVQSNNGIGILPSSIWHGDSRIERLACLQHPETYNQELAHCRYYDLFGLEAARFLEARDKSSNYLPENYAGYEQDYRYTITTRTHTRISPTLFR
jgi:hypothetical protein